MPPPPPPLHARLAYANDDSFLTGSAEDDDSNDQEDISDCNVSGPALSAIGRALGLHTEEDDSDSDSDSGSENGGGAADRKLLVEKQPMKKEIGSAKDPGEDEEAKEGGMTLSDLIWW